MKRLYKRKARQAYEAGQTVTVVPCRMYPVGGWGMALPITKADFPDESFDNRINNFAFYNCCYETGYYPAFYVPEVRHD